jgi:tetratricopeptide (TPR) repeat protein
LLNWYQKLNKDTIIGWQSRVGSRLTTEELTTDLLEPFEFVFWEILKAFALVVVALLAAKAAKSFVGSGRSRTIRLLLYAVILALVVFGAQVLGMDVAAEVYSWACQKNLDRHDNLLAFSNARRAVDLRPDVFRYWQLLSRSKFDLRQFDSLLRDESALRALSPTGLDEDDLWRFAYCHYFLGQYNDAVSLTKQFIRTNPGYPKSYILQGQAEVNLRQYSEAERDFVKSLEILPTQADAVEGLAHAYFLSGNTAQAVAVLDATSHYSFPPQARDRFEALKSLYEQ